MTGNDKKPTKDEVARIVSEQMPGWTPVEHGAADAASSGRGEENVDVLSPSISAIKQNYGLSDNADGGGPDAEARADRNTHVVTVQSKDKKKTIGIQGKKIIWEQG